MHFIRCWLYFVLLLIPVPVFSAVTYETVRVGPGMYAPNGATQHNVTIATPRPASPTKYHQIVPVMPKGTLGRLGRAAVRGGPASVAVVGIIEGLGYLIDQVTGEIKKIDVQVIPSGNYVSPSSIQSSQASGACVVDSPTPLSGYQFFYIEVLGTCSSTHQRIYWANYSCPASHPYGDVVPSGSSRYARCFANATTVENIIDLDPSDYQVIDNSLANQLTLQQKTDLARRILTMTNSEIATIWPELSALAEAVRAAEQAILDAQTDPAVIPTPEQETIVEDGRQTLPDQQTDSSGGIWPGFCEWASFICAPFVESEHPPLPTADIDIDDYDSGLPSTAVCPVPLEVVTSFGQWEISFDPACQLAEAIRVPLLAISYLIAGFIVVGVRR